ncbi:DcaP family trimeric outer membrane transporter [Marinobacter zhejiangensis]|uniref:Porin subfamily protein n=1 Tax=Marinobacter zhejiangensis TaxID=488535 RepID=A0A1I4T4K9_9GAMM|nr:DcaP family trimeric outer membrane transporter [Marinobacter zhejiangensis]SFM71694.1 Porin subfamily protein [Marinobacter zhejiangensis]
MNNKVKYIAAAISFLNFGIFTTTASAIGFEAGDTQVTIKGYGKLDLIYDLDAKLGNAASNSAVRLDGETGADGHFDAHAFQTRIGLQTDTPTEAGNLKTYIEGDFWGNGGGTLRLRHAYGEWNGVLAGQTTTNFTSFLGFTPTVDFTGQVGQPNISRHAQLRYTYQGLSVAIEDPSGLGGVTYSGVADVEAKSSLPDLTLRYERAGERFSYATSVLVRQLEAYNAVSDDEDSELGYGASLAAKLRLTPTISVQGSVVYGEGVGGYLYLGPAAPAYVDPRTGQVDAITAVGGTLGMTVNAGQGSYNLAYGLGQADWDDAYDAGAVGADRDDKYQSFYLNYIWSPVKNVDYGVEVSHHTREVVDGRDGAATRLQMMAKYSF